MTPCQSQNATRPRCVRMLAQTVAVALALLPLARAADAPTIPGSVDVALPRYEPTGEMRGRLKSVGSDTMNKMMTLWFEAFMQMHPLVRVEIEGKGSSTAPPALIAGTCTFGVMSRPITEHEESVFRKRYDYAVTVIPVAVDMLTVFVHKDNPVSCITLPQLDGIFSEARLSGNGEKVSTWGQLGVNDAILGPAPIRAYGRNQASGTHAFFRERVLAGGRFNESVREQPSSAAVVASVAADRFAIGYSGFGYTTEAVRVVPLAAAAEQPCVSPSDGPDSTAARYPLTRFMYICANLAPDEPVEPLQREFLRFVLSQQGQAVVVRCGFLPIAAADVASVLAKLAP